MIIIRKIPDNNHYENVYADHDDDQFAFVTSVSEQTLFCIPSDGIRLLSGGGHYSGYWMS